jgi:hypothetical protein
MAEELLKRDQLLSALAKQRRPRRGESHTVRERHRESPPDSPRKIDGAVAAVIAFDRPSWRRNETPVRPIIEFV